MFVQHVYYSLNSSKGGYIGDYIGDYYRVIKGDTRSLDYSLEGEEVRVWLSSCQSRNFMQTFQIHTIVTFSILFSAF